MSFKTILSDFHDKLSASECVRILRDIEKADHTAVRREARPFLEGLLIGLKARNRKKGKPVLRLI